jgi:hypothetical protein
MCMATSGLITAFYKLYTVDILWSCFLMCMATSGLIYDKISLIVYFMIEYH